ncbi:hypothetical protein INR49_003949, partial [Caranx melampygus]
MDSQSKVDEPFPTPPPYFLPDECHTGQDIRVYHIHSPFSPPPPPLPSFLSLGDGFSQTHSPLSASAPPSSNPRLKFVSYEPELHRSPALTTCPYCQTQVTTQVDYQVGTYAWLMCLVFVLCGLVFGCCLIPFFVKHFRDAYHTCPRCRQVLHVHRKTSHLPTAKGVSGAELAAKRRDRLVSSSQTDSFPASSSDGSLSKPQQQRHASQSSVKSEPELKTRTRHQEEARFTLTLTPEAVLLLQRRNSERRQRSAARNAESGAGVSGSATDSRRRRENVSKRHQSATLRHSTPNSRAAARKNSDAELGDISSIVKISLLNEQHKYDDVEYEEEECYGVDERVVLKCTEWLRGLENTP